MSRKINGICALAVFILSAGGVMAGHSVDEDPRETSLDPGDLFLPGGILEVDDACPPAPHPSPCLGVPDDVIFDLDAISLRNTVDVCGPGIGLAPRGIVFSLDDGDPGPGSGPPDRAIELFFYDRCNGLGGGSFLTNATESFLDLGTNPPGTHRDDDVDAYEAQDITAAWGSNVLFFSPDEPSMGGLPADTTCPGSGPHGNVYVTGQSISPPGLVASPCDLGVPDPTHCNIDALTFVSGEPPFNGGALLFSTDDDNDCGLDPGDIYISDASGSLAVWADDINDLGIALTDSQPVDIDAISLNTSGQLDILDPFDPMVWKRGWCDYAPSGMPDFSQDHASFPTGPQGGTLYDGPVAIADAFWWLDSKFEGNCGGTPGDLRDKHRLVERSPGTVDDHSPANVQPVIQQLAHCMGAGGTVIPGTSLTDMHQCVGQWLQDKELRTDYRINSTVAPDITDIACAVERSDTTVLELGFWWEDASGGFNRCGGHWVTVSGADIPRNPGPDGQPGIAGIDDDNDGKVDDVGELCPCGTSGMTIYGDDVCPGPQRLARLGLSDPAFNNAEPSPDGLGGLGRVLGPDHFNHAPGLLPVIPDHDNAVNVSHDVYLVRPAATFGATHGLLGYASASPVEPAVSCETVHRFCDQNPFPGGFLPFQACDPLANTRVSVEIEAMFTMGPTTCEICLDYTSPIPAPLSVRLGPPLGPACPAGPSGTVPLDYVRGQVCQLGNVPSSSSIAVSLGEVDVLEEQTPLLRWIDTTTPVNTDASIWYYLVKEPPPVNYGFSSAGLPRQPGRLDCP